MLNSAFHIQLDLMQSSTKEQQLGGPLETGLVPLVLKVVAGIMTSEETGIPTLR
jgi:hypothetical protein